MLVLLATIGLLMATATDDRPVGALASIRKLNPHLSADDPRELPMKLRSLRRGPYDFFRGTAELYYAWCRVHCDDWAKEKDGLVLLHGDVHPGNTGTFRSPGESDPLHFSLVDLDESIEGPFQLDLLRAMTSLRFAAAEMKVELSSEDWHDLSHTLCKRYENALVETDANIDTTIQDEFKVVTKLTKEVEEDGDRAFFARFLESPAASRFRTVVLKKDRPGDLLEPIETAERNAIIKALWEYCSGDAGVRRRQAIGCTTAAELELAVKDVRRWTRFDSSGSQGVQKFLVLLQTQAVSNRPGPLILQFKEQPVPAAARAGLLKSNGVGGRGAAVARAHASLQCHPSMWIGSAVVNGREFLIKPKSAHEEEPSLKDLNKPKEIKEMARLLGTLLGMGHARSIGRDPVRIEKMMTRCGGLPKALDARSLAAFENFMAAYDELMHDENASAIADRADAFIRSETSGT